MSTTLNGVPVGPPPPNRRIWRIATREPAITRDGTRRRVAAVRGGNGVVLFLAPVKGGGETLIRPIFVRTEET